MSENLPQWAKLSPEEFLERRTKRRTKWHGLLPKDVADSQSSWDRCAMVARMRMCGLTQRQCAERLGVSAANIYQMDERYRRNMRKSGGVSPLEKYLAEKPPALSQQQIFEVAHLLSRYSIPRDWLFVHTLKPIWRFTK